MACPSRIVLTLAGYLVALNPLVHGDTPQMIDLKQKASAGDATAELTLGEAYCNGADGLPRDYIQAMALFQKATAQNVHAAESDIGALYENGLGVPRDPAQAVLWFTKGAQGGNAYGEFQLGACYGSGFGVSKDATQAVAWYRKAALQGNDEALTRLGLSLQQGIGTPVDLQEGFTSLLRAAYDNSAWAQYCLSQTYLRGEFVPRDLIEAQRWALLASRNGYNNSNEARTLTWLAGQLTPAQFGQAQVLAANWDREHFGDWQPATVQISYASGGRALIPLQDIYNELMVTATINGHSNLRFWVDTGCNNSLIDATTAASLGLSPGAVYRPGMGIGPDSLLMRQIEHVTLQLPGVTFSGINLGQTSTSSMDGQVGGHVDGFLGSDLLRHTGMRIDYVHHTLELIDSAAFKAMEKTGTELTAAWRGQCLMVTGVVGNHQAFSAPTPLLFDTGSAGALLLSRNFVDRNRTLNLTGGFSDPESGMGGILATSTLKLSELKMGDIAIEDPAASIADVNQGMLASSSGILGNEILRRFDVVIDYPENRIFLNPNAQFNDPFIYANSGLDVRATGADFRTYVVHEVTPSTPGALGGFKAGDILTQFDGVPLSTKTMTEARRLFHTGGKHKVVVTRDDKPITLDYVRDDIPIVKTGT